MIDFKIFDNMISNELNKDIFQFITNKNFINQPYFLKNKNQDVLDLKKRNSYYIHLDDKNITHKLLKILKENINQDAIFTNKIKIIKYEKDGHFIKHRDLIQNKEKNKSYTLILYLNENYKQGNTILYDEEIKRKFVIPVIKNRILLFKPDILHKGSRVKEGEKLILTTQIAF